MVRIAIAFLAVGAALVMAAPAAADSLVFINNSNVWIANADGTGQYEVTLDGTAASPYSSPSEADDGTIVALRTPPGGRPEIWRMHQNGGLVNPPINTPAPGTGAIDARVSPDGTLVAYWFVTTVNDGLCAFCVDVASRVLISHVDRFTAPTEVGTPNTGSMPSWMSNNTLLLSNGNATQWYYTLGMPEAAEWWGDTDNCGGCANPVGLTDGEVSRDGQRIALVRGDNHESIWLYRTTGPPPSIPTAECALTGAVGGAFASPTWSANGQILAWQEGNGVWSADVPDITNCQSITPSQLIIPGGSDPTFSPANLDPGARPPCDNPGNPTTCPPSPVTPSPATPSPAIVRGRLATLLSAYARTLRRLRIGGLRRQRHIAVAFTAPSAGVLAVTLSTTGARPTALAGGRLTFTAAGTRTVTLPLTRPGLALLRHARRVSGRLTATFSPSGGSPTVSHSGLTLTR